MFCKNCGKALPDSAKFCTECGMNINYIKEIKQEIRQETIQEIEQETEQETENHSQSNLVENKYAEVKKRRWSASKICIAGSIICLSVFLVLTIIDLIDYISYMLNSPFFNWPFYMWLEDSWYPLIPAVALFILGLIIKKISKKKKKVAVRPKKVHREKRVLKIVKRTCVTILSISILSLLAYGGYKIYSKVQDKKHNDQLYSEAIALTEQGDYESAKQIFWKITDRDVSEELMNCNYVQAKQLHEKGMFKEAYSIFRYIVGYEDVDMILAGKEYDREKLYYQWTDYGSIVKFGQNEWVVLTISEDKALLLSKDVLYTTKFERTDERDSQLLWKSGSVRQYLNSGGFLNTFFSEDEKACIITTTLSTLDKYAAYSGEHEKDKVYETEDRVFLLSQDEVRNYPRSGICIDKSWLLRSTSYSKRDSLTWGNRTERDLYVVAANSTEVVKKSCYEESVNTSFSGFPDDIFNIEYNEFGIRPAMWVDYEKAIELELGTE